MKTFFICVSLVILFTFMVPAGGGAHVAEFIQRSFIAFALIGIAYEFLKKPK